MSIVNDLNDVYSNDMKYQIEISSKIANVIGENLSISKKDVLIIVETILKRASSFYYIEPKNHFTRELYAIKSHMIRKPIVCGTVNVNWDNHIFPLLSISSHIVFKLDDAFSSILAMNESDILSEYATIINESFYTRMMTNIYNQFIPLNKITDGFSIINFKHNIKSMIESKHKLSYKTFDTGSILHYIQKYHLILDKILLGIRKDLQEKIELAMNLVMKRIDVINEEVGKYKLIAIWLYYINQFLTLYMIYYTEVIVCHNNNASEMVSHISNLFEVGE